MTNAVARVGLIQMSSGEGVTANLAAAEGYIQTAVSQGAQVVLLPECFALMPKNVTQLRQRAEPAEPHGSGQIQDFLRQLAVRLRIWIIAGSVPLRSDDPERVFNTLLVYNADGENVARYDKIHLFDARLPSGENHCESSYTLRGNRCVVVQTPIGRVGLSVCYDLRFPELYRALVAKGAGCLVVPSAFTVSTGKAHWLTLLRARAIENSCYVLAAAQVGKTGGGRITYGHSVAIDPWGETVALLKSDPGILIAEIDPARVQRIRAQLPSLAHRRDDLFAYESPIT